LPLDRVGLSVALVTSPTEVAASTSPAQVAALDTFTSYAAISDSASEKPLQLPEMLEVDFWYWPSAPSPSRTCAAVVTGGTASTVTPFEAVQAPALPAVSMARTQSK